MFSPLIFHGLSTFAEDLEHRWVDSSDTAARDEETDGLLGMGAGGDDLILAACRSRDGRPKRRRRRRRRCRSSLPTRLRVFSRVLDDGLRSMIRVHTDRRRRGERVVVRCPPDGGAQNDDGDGIRTCERPDWDTGMMLVAEMGAAASVYDRLVVSRELMYWMEDMQEREYQPRRTIPALGFTGRYPSPSPARMNGGASW